MSALEIYDILIGQENLTLEVGGNVVNWQRNNVQPVSILILPPPVPRLSLR